MKFLLAADDPGFRNQLFEIRKSLEMSRVDFAKFCNISRANVRRYEDINATDKCSPRETNWNSIKEALDRIDYFNLDILSFVQYTRSKLLIPDSIIKTVWQPVVPHCEKVIDVKNIFTVEGIRSEIDEYPKFKKFNWIDTEWKIRIKTEFFNILDAITLYREMRNSGLVAIRNWVE